MNPVLTRLVEERDEQVAFCDQLTTAAQAEERDLTDSELELVERAKQRVDVLDRQITPLQEIEERRTRADALSAKLRMEHDKLKVDNPVGGARVKREERTYNPESQNNFVRDAMLHHFFRDVEAGDRLGRHMREEAIEQRASAVANFAGLVIPQYLVDNYAPLAYAGRPFANTVRSNPLPAQGTSFQISRLTTGSSVGVQSSEGAEVSTADPDDTALTVSLVTIAGEVTVSRQSIERSPYVDPVLVQDLIENYSTTLDGQLLTAVIGTSGINAVTYTDTNPTVGELWGKIADASQQVASGIYRGATHALFHPRRWGWMTAGLDTAGRPVFPPSAGSNPMGDGTPGGAYGPVGNVQGLTAVTDANVATNEGAGTNQDYVLVYRANDVLLWENGATPNFLRFEEVTGSNNVATLQVKLVAYSYVAYTAGRYPAAVSKIAGTGLVSPTF